jgi:hypothetical protein
MMTTVPGSLDKKGGSRCHLLLNKRWNLLHTFLSTEPGTLFCKRRKCCLGRGFFLAISVRRMAAKFSPTNDFFVCLFQSRLVLFCGLLATRASFSFPCVGILLCSF